MVKSKNKDPKLWKYTYAQLKAAVAEVQRGQSIRVVSKKYKIPRSTLNNKVKDSSPKIKKGGPPTVLKENEEKHLVSWMLLMSDNGFPTEFLVVAG